MHHGGAQCFARKSRFVMKADVTEVGERKGGGGGEGLKRMSERDCDVDTELQECVCACWQPKWEVPVLTMETETDTQGRNKLTCCNFPYTNFTSS